MKLTVIIVLHDLNLASEYCTNIAIMKQGEIFKYGIPEEIFSCENLENVYNIQILVQKNPITNKPYIILC